LQYRDRKKKFDCCFQLGVTILNMISHEVEYYTLSLYIAIRRILQIRLNPRRHYDVFGVMEHTLIIDVSCVSVVL